MPLKPAPTPVAVPLSAPVSTKAVATLSAVKLLVPAPPSIAPDSVPPWRIKRSANAPPVTLPIPVKPPPTPVTVPVSKPVITKVLTSSLTVRRLVPPPPSIDPVKRLPLRIKLSFWAPVVRFWMLTKPPSTPVMVPLSVPVRTTVVATLPVVKRLVPPPPSIDPVRLPPIKVKLSF